MKQIQKKVGISKSKFLELQSNGILLAIKLLDATALDKIKTFGPIE